MAHLSERELNELFELFEAELRILWNMDRLEKMKLRRRIRNVLWPIVNTQTVDPDLVMGAIKEKLGDVIRLFRDRNGFLEKLYDFLSDALLGDVLSKYERQKRKLRALGC